MSKERRATKPKKSIAGKEKAELVQYGTSEKERREDSKSSKHSDVEHRENFERDFTYAKSEIGRLALRFLKNTSLPQRIAGVVLVVVLSLGVGIAVGIYQLPAAVSSGFGVFEEKDDEALEDENTTDKEDENVTVKEDTVTESDNESVDEKPVLGQSPFEQSDSELFRVTGPITASQIKRTDFHNVVFYGWRPGDTAFYPITQFGAKSGFTDKTINLSELDANMLNGVQLLWVDNEYRYRNVWSIQ